MKLVISIIIPNFNGLKLLKICLQSLKKQTFKNSEIIIVDNGSTDSSVAFIKENYSSCQIIQLDKNYGFAKAVNEGIKKSKGKYVVLLNNDTEVDKNFLKHLVETADQQDVGFLTAKRFNYYKRNLIDSAGDDMDSAGHLILRGFGQKNSAEFDKSGYIFLASGGSCLIKKEVFEKIGYFDEDYFMYMEDADFFFRAQLAGFQGWYEPRAVVYHMRMASSKNLDFVEYLNFRNMMANIIKNFPWSLLIHNFNWLKIILVNINTIRYLSCKGLLWQGIKAEAYILYNLPKLLKKRKNIQQNKKVSDEYIINKILNKKFI